MATPTIPAGSLAAFSAMGARRLLVFGGIALIAGGMLFGDIFAVFVLHQNGGQTGQAGESGARLGKTSDNGWPGMRPSRWPSGRQRFAHPRSSGPAPPTPVRARNAEQALIGEPPSAAAAARAQQALARDIAPIDDIRSERDYRMTVAGNVLDQFLRAADPRFMRGS